MKYFWCISVMMSVLFMSMDGAADIATEGHAHGDGAIHATDNLASNPPSDTDPDNDHCEQCCHGHSASMSATLASVTTPFVTADQRTSRSAYVRNFAQAPPTPPPNA